MKKKELLTVKKNKSTLCLLLGAIYLALFFAVTIGLVCSGFGDFSYDRFITGLGDRLGDGRFFCELNLEMYELFGNNPFWYDLTEILGLVCFLFPLAFAGMGLFQLCKRKSLKKVDKDLYFLAGLYVVTGIFYVLFEKIVINYRPIITEDGIEASFPSSHTVLVCVFAGSAAFFLARRIRNRWLRVGVVVLCAALTALVSFGRLLAGVHWFTDVLGGVLLAGGLVLLCKGLVLRFCARPQR